MSRTRSLGAALFQHHSCRRCTGGMLSYCRDPTISWSEISSPDTITRLWQRGTPVETKVAPREASSPASEKAPSERHIINEVAESIKRGLDENPPSTPGMTPRPNPGMERTKKGRFQPTLTFTQNDRR
ncbi:uncharacterized protein ISCGN_010299 [Ixodes scapularis]